MTSLIPDDVHSRPFRRVYKIFIGFALLASIIPAAGYVAFVIIEVVSSFGWLIEFKISPQYHQFNMFCILLGIICVVPSCTAIISQPKVKLSTKIRWALLSILANIIFSPWVLALEYNDKLQERMNKIDPKQQATGSAMNKRSPNTN